MKNLALFWLLVVALLVGCPTAEVDDDDSAVDDDDASGADDDDSSPPDDDDSAPETCAVTVTNATGFELDEIYLQPSGDADDDDERGIGYELLQGTPLADGASASGEVEPGEWLVEAFRVEGEAWFVYDSGSFLCEGAPVDVTVEADHLLRDLLTVWNDHDADVTTLTLASTEDLVMGENLVVDEPLVSMGYLELVVDDGNYWLEAEATDGTRFLGNGFQWGSWASHLILDEPTSVTGPLCTWTIDNLVGLALVELSLYDTDWNFYFEALFDSRGDLPSGETLDVLAAPGTWTIEAADPNWDVYGVEATCVGGEAATVQVTTDDQAR